MKKFNQKRILGLSLITAMFLATGVNAGQIKTDTETAGWDVNTQYGFTGWNLENVLVKIVSVDDFTTALPGTSFNEDTGVYTPMTYGMSFESEISAGSEVRGLLHGKNWPVGEPAGIKIINNDMNTKNGKPENCIMTTSYLDADNTGTGVSGYLDTTAPAGPVPTICSSPFQSHKRFKINMMPAMVANPDVDGYGQPVELVFDLVGGDTSAKRYQMFQKINNYTGKRLDGCKLEVLDAAGNPNPALTLSIGLDEHRDKDGNLDESDIWAPEDMANFAHGLWEPIDDHFLTNGFFDSERSGFVVDPSGHNTSTLVGGPATLAGNYEALFGLWLTSKWAPIGIFHDFDDDPLTDADLVAFWGTIPNAPVGTAPAWHKGKDYDLSNGDQSWAEPTSKEMLNWDIDPLYEPGLIEDTLNLGLNYIVNVGDNSAIGTKFTLKITPHIAADQTPPNYIEDDNVTYIEPPKSYVATAGTVSIAPEPTFTPATPVYVGVADADLNMYPLVKEEVTITVTADTGDSESITLIETDVDTAVFSATLPTENSGSASIVNNGIMSVVEGTVVTATYVDTHYGNTDTVETLTAFTIAKTPVIDDGDDAVDSEGQAASSGGGGGCTYNQNSKSFDMMFLFIAAFGLLFPFRRRFLK